MGDCWCNMNGDFLFNYESASRFSLDFLWSKRSSVDDMVNKISVKEMLTLQRLADEKNIRIAFFKGMIEKIDTYDNANIRRLQHDIDVLVSPDDVLDFKNICKSAGFNISELGEEISDEWVNDSLNNENKHHLPLILKYFFGRSICLGLEIHVAIDSMWRRKEISNSLCREMLSRRVSITKSIPLYGLDIYDRLIISMHHFAKHFLANCLTYYYEKTKLFECKTLLDAFLIIKKYAISIDSELLALRAEHYEMLEHVKFASTVMSQLFHFDVNELRIFEKLYCHKYKRNIANIPAADKADLVLRCATKSVGNLLVCSDIDFYKRFIFNCLNQNIQVDASNAKKQCSLPLKSFATSNVEPQTEATFLWDDMVATFAFSFEQPLKHHNSNNKFNDGISIRLYNPSFSFEKDNAVRNILICAIKNESDKDSIIATYNGVDSFRIGARQIPCKWMSKNSLNCFSVSFDWKELMIDISENSYIGIELMIQRTSNTGNESPQLFYFSNCVSPHHNPAKFGLIRLKSKDALC